MRRVREEVVKCERFADSRTSIGTLIGNSTELDDWTLHILQGSHEIISSFGDGEESLSYIPQQSEVENGRAMLK